MNRAAVGLVAAVILIPASFLLGGQLVSPSAAQSGTEKELKSISPATVQTRGSQRSMFYVGSVGSGAGGTSQIGAAEEMDVSSVTFTSVILPAGTAFPGVAYVTWNDSQNPNSSVYPINLGTSGSGTVHVEFNPAIPIRSGDSVTFTPAATVPIGGSASWQFVLNGTVPSTVRTSGVVME